VIVVSNFLVSIVVWFLMELDSWLRSAEIRVSPSEKAAIKARSLESRLLKLSCWQSFTASVLSLRTQQCQ
jgi:hypothetical protein